MAVHLSLVQLFAFFVVVPTCHSAIHFSDYEAINADVAVTNLQPAIVTSRGVIGCALICFRVPLRACSGFVFVSQNRSCLALSGHITGDVGGYVTDVMTYRRKIPITTTTTDLPASTASPLTPTTAVIVATPPPPTTTTTTTTTPPPPTTTTTTTTTPPPPPTTTTTTTPSPPSTLSPTCQSPFTIYQTYCFNFIYRRDGPGAKSSCEGISPPHSYLAYVDTSAKLSTVRAYIASQLPPNEYYETYLGFRRRTPTGPFQYDVDDQILPDSHPLWSHSGFPDADPAKVYGCSGKSQNFWNSDGTGTWSFHSVCEILL